MPASKSQQKAVSRYMKKNYDDIKLRVAKGERDKIKAFADANGESVNGLINRLLEEEMKKDIKK